MAATEISASTLDNPHAWRDKADRVRRMFSSVAPTYDFLNHLHSANIDRLWRKRTVEWSQVPPGGRVLDLCTGTADLAMEYAGSSPAAGPVVGSDFCHEMLAHGRRKLAMETGPSRRVTLVEADAQQLPFPNDSFDVVSCAFGLRNLSQPERGLAECLRVLRPGGRLVVLEFTLPACPVMRAMYQFYFRTIMPLAATILSGDRTGAYRYLPNSVATWQSPAELEARFRAAGFVDTDHRLLTFGIAAVHRGRKPTA